MKKTILLVMLMFVVPAMGTVKITCEDSVPGSYKASIYYDRNDEVELVRAFALDIQVTAGTIVDVNNINPKYYIYPGTIIIDANGDVTNWGTPVAPANDPGAAGTGLGTDRVIIELGSLYEQGDDGNTPDANGLLCEIEVSGVPLNQVCSISITPEPTRGGVVMEDSSTADVNAPGCLLGPTAWGFACFDCGDADGNCEVSSADVLILLDGWSPNPYDGRGDFDKNGEIASSDVLRLLDHWPPTPEDGCLTAEGCSPCTPI